MHLYCLYPILLSLLVLHSTYICNRSEMPLKTYFESIFVMTFISLSGYFLLNLFVNKILLSALLFSVFYLLFANSNKIYIYLLSKRYSDTKQNYIIFNIIFLLFSFIFCLILFFAFRNANLLIFSKSMFYILAFMNIFSFFNVISIKDVEKRDIDLTEFGCISNKENLPNIFHIVLDSHPGYILESNRDEVFFKELEKRGFHTIKNFKSNYNMTHLSMPSILNMDYIHNLLDKEKSDKYSVVDIYKYYGHNRLWALLDKMGYDINVVAHPLFNKMIEETSTKINFQPIKYINTNLRVLCFLSFFSFLITPIKKSHKYFYQIIDNYNKLCLQKNDKNTYNFLHLLSPHDPMLFDKDGKKLNRNESNDYKNFKDYVIYTDKKILEIIDTIKNNADNNSIIILHGDHGIKSTEQAWFDTLCSVYMPKKIVDYGENLTAVNLFRYILCNALNFDIKFLNNEFFITNDRSNVTELPSNFFDSKENYSICNQQDYIIEDAKKLLKRYQNKRIVLYGGGIQYFKFKSRNIFANSDIVALSDIKYKELNKLTWDSQIGFNVISPLQIHTLKPDIVIICNENPNFIEEYFKNNLFAETKQTFRYDFLITEKGDYANVKREKWRKVLFP